MPHTLSLLLPAALTLLGASPQPALEPCAATAVVAPTPPRLPEASRALRDCVRRDLRRGAWTQADRRLVAARAATSTLPGAYAEAWTGLVDRLVATRIVDAHAWDRAVGLAARLELRTPWLVTMVRGVSTARQAWATQDAAAFARALDDARALARRGDEADDLEIRRAARLVQAAVAGGQYERDEMQLLLDEARATEAALQATLGDAYVPVVIARELEADLWLQTDRFAAAAAAYKDVIAAHPWRVQPWLGLAEAYRRLGYTREAAQCLTDARAMAPDFTFESGEPPRTPARP